RLSYCATLEDVRARVNAILALSVMVMALIAALGFWQLSRRTRAESRRIKRESDELRILNRRLSAEIAARLKLERNLKEAEQSLEQASKLAALGQMSAAVSHELNQPLAAMKTYLAGARLLLQRRRAEEALSSFQRIDDLIERMGGITRQLKSYARKGEAELQPVDVRECVRAALAMMAPELGKLGVTVYTIKSGSMKDIGSLYREMSEEEVKVMEGIVDEYFQLFKEKVVAYRGSVDPEVFTGRPFAPKEAVAVGLVDGVADYEEALRRARELAGLPPDAPVVELKPRPLTLLDLLLRGASSTRSITVPRLLILAMWPPPEAVVLP
ncbi:MAG: S49 family peptidase, partial [Thermofilum sp.]